MINAINIEIHLGNEAMQTTEDVVSLLRRVIYHLEDKGCDHEAVPFKTQSLKDVNGNSVGFLNAVE